MFANIGAFGRSDSYGPVSLNMDRTTFVSWDAQRLSNALSFFAGGWQPGAIFVEHAFVSGICQ